MDPSLSLEKLGTKWIFDKTINLSLARRGKLGQWGTELCYFRDLGKCFSFSVKCIVKRNVKVEIFQFPFLLDLGWAGYKSSHSPWDTKLKTLKRKTVSDLKPTLALSLHLHLHHMSVKSSECLMCQSVVWVTFFHPSVSDPLSPWIMLRVDKKWTIENIKLFLKGLDWTYFLSFI